MSALEELLQLFRPEPATADPFPAVNALRPPAPPRAQPEERPLPMPPLQRPGRKLFAPEQAEQFRD